MPPLPEPIAHTVDAIYDAIKGAEKRFERTYLGGSRIGEECERLLWYEFRWAAPPEDFNGRKLRLFDTGHREEARLIADLRRAGIEVWETDADGRQWGVEDVEGHFRGHLDGVVRGLPEAPKAEHVLECKTHSEKSFKEVVTGGVKASKPVHYGQMQVYMDLMGIDRALYLAVNKNTDELYAERVAHDPVEAGRLRAKASRVINAPRPLPGIATAGKPHFRCNYPCPARAVCLEGAFARRNCRTCLHSSPVPGGWLCGKHGHEPSTREQVAGCGDHRFIPDLVPGEQTDVSGDDAVVYRLANGTEWTDTGGPI